MNINYSLPIIYNKKKGIRIELIINKVLIYIY